MNHDTFYVIVQAITFHLTFAPFISEVSYWFGFEGLYTFMFQYNSLSISLSFLSSRTVLLEIDIQKLVAVSFLRKSLLAQINFIIMVLNIV